MRTRTRRDEDARAGLQQGDLSGAEHGRDAGVGSLEQRGPFRLGSAGESALQHLAELRDHLTQFGVVGHGCNELDGEPVLRGNGTEQGRLALDITVERVREVQWNNRYGPYKGYKIDGIAGPVFCRMLGIPAHP